MAPPLNLSPYFLYGTAWKEDETAGLVFEALQAGFRGIDTANQRRHYFEEAVGEGIARFLKSSSVKREALFLQSKYTFARGQDHRLPYDPKADIATQVRQSFESSLKHLQTDYLDSLVLHGPTNGRGMVDADWEAWGAMEKLAAEGKVKFLGVSNCNEEQLATLFQRATIKPRFLQNRCYASAGWDLGNRQFCKANEIIYQGFSLLTANTDSITGPEIARIAKSHAKTIPQVIFRFCLDVGMLPLTGTTDPDHMAMDLDIFDFKLSAEEISLIEQIAR